MNNNSLLLAYVLKNPVNPVNLVEENSTFSAQDFRWSVAFRHQQKDEKRHNANHYYAHAALGAAETDAEDALQELEEAIHNRRDGPAPECCQNHHADDNAQNCQKNRNRVNSNRA